MDKYTQKAIAYAILSLSFWLWRRVLYHTPQ